MKSALVASTLLACLAGWLADNATVWSPYQVGAGIGVLSWLTFYFSDKPIGASSAYANLAGVLGRALAPQHTARLKYFRENPPGLLRWENLFLLGATLGAFLAATSGDAFAGRWLSPLWRQRFGEDSLLLRLVVAFTGGAFMAMGARMAGGCTSGHGISGTMQLALSSWLTTLTLFASGIITAVWLFGGR